MTSQLPRKKLLIFDLDGTLIDSVPDLANSVNFMLHTLKRETFSQEEIRSWVGNGAQILVKRALSGSDTIAPNLDEELFQNALRVFLKHYQENLCVHTTLYPHVAQTLEYLYNQKYILAIVTNKPSDFVKPILDKLHISHLFSAVLGADSLSEKKPHPLPLLHLCKKFQIDPKHAVMIGDSKNDILAAQAANIHSIGVSYGYNYEESIEAYKPDIVVDNFEKLLFIFRKKIAIIGGGIAGSSVALYLSQLPLEISLFEKKASLVDGPPICHLHAGGNLYREISDAQCLQLLRESIEFVRLYPHCVDYRPTAIITPDTDEQDPMDLLKRLKKLQKEYTRLIAESLENKVLGETENYFKLYDKQTALALKKQKIPKQPCSFDEWMISLVHSVDLQKIKFPIIMVQEYGLNIFRLAASATLLLQKKENVHIFTDTKVSNLKKHAEDFDFIINAAGFESGEIDDTFGFTPKRFVEFKAAYVTKWREELPFPEIIFHGKRGTPQGMAQFTPYPEGYFQLHGMTKEITLFEDGLVQNSPLSAQPKLSHEYIEKIYTGWSVEKVHNRTKKAIEHIAQYIPDFKDAQVTNKPLYGAQQIPGEDESLRAADVSFENDNYARCEIVKASSVVSMARTVANKLLRKHNFRFKDTLNKEEVDSLAKELCIQRGYPKALSGVRVKKLC